MSDAKTEKPTTAKPGWREEVEKRKASGLVRRRDLIDILQDAFKDVPQEVLDSLPSSDPDEIDTLVGNSR